MVKDNGGNCFTNEMLGEAEAAIKKEMERYHVFENSETQNRQQVSELITKIDTMVKDNGGNCFTNEMLGEAEAAIKKEMERILKEKEEEIKREREELERKHEEEKEDKQIQSEKEEKKRIDEKLEKSREEMKRSRTQTFSGLC
uniref:vicilin-like seed storage protein At2g18540 n=1 Tax=Maylandia zebra TaxID=106582 RepID=UPI000D2FF52E|nr:vicilin-like seed storage protein At2g18540 [Maylandia zebra]